MFSSKIASTGLGLPSKTLTNADLEKMVDTSDEWITSRTGIKERKIIDPTKEGHTDLAVRAVEEILKKSNLKPTDIDLIISCTITPDTFMPNSSSRIVDRIGARGIASFDLNSACAGWLSGMHVAKSLVETGAHRNVIVIGIEVLSRHLDYTDRTTCILFGDAAGATLVTRAEEGEDSKIIDSCLYTWPDSNESLAMMGSGSLCPPHDPNWGKEYDSYIKMKGSDVFKQATKGMAKAATELLEKNKVSIDDIKWMIPHQANIRIIDMVAHLLKFDRSKVFVNIEKYGNTSSATMPICLYEMEKEGLIKKGDLLLFDTFGGGFTFGAMLVKW